MRKEENIVSYAADEIDTMIAQGEDRTDWDRVNAMTDEEIEANAASDEDADWEWSDPLPVSFNLTGKRQLTIRLDEDVLDWFKSHGPGYQTRINAVLRSFVESHSDSQVQQRRKAS